VRRAIVTSTATVSGIILMLGLKSHPAGATGSAGGQQPIGLGNAPAPTTTSSAPSDSSGGSGGSSGGSTGGSTTQPGSGSASSSAASGPSASRTVTGSAADTRYGPVQVQLTLVGKKITNIEVVQYPSESSRDQEINSYALPVLNQETMTAQSAQIDAVSGATYSSDGYIQSLQSALDQAGA
jgi:uncharacterized protein with FMN-binding domain